MENCFDFLERIGPDASSKVLTSLDDPTDLVRLSSVSKSWWRFVISNGFCKKLMMRMCPELSILIDIIENGSSTGAAEVGSSSAREWESLEREHRVYSYLSRDVVSPVAKENCIVEPIGASSTDNYPDEKIDYTLEPSDRADMRPSYWSSKGERDPTVPEKLTYRLKSTLCVVHEIKIRPFRAFFQYGCPIYSVKAVRFRMGHSMLAQKATIDDIAISQGSSEDNYIWTYVSPEFPMVQENALQSFKLPRPVICIGGIVQIELLGRVQRQELDGLYYICVSHVKVIGRALSPVFHLDFNKVGSSVLKYDSNARCSIPSERKIQESNPQVQSGWQAFVMRVRELRWNHAILNTLLGTVPAIVEEDDDFS